jgi:MtrB/PioB family decaheme-associated outer membrane protein
VEENAMRNRLGLTTAALVLASATYGWAQQPAPEPQPTTPTFGVVDFGLRATSYDGDAARYERYRDLKDGAYSRLVLNNSTDRYLFSASAENVGYDDQRYFLDFANGAVKANASFIGTPLNYGYNTSTPWIETAPGVFSLDAATRLAVQNRAPGVLGIPANAAQAQQVSIYRGLARPFDITALRNETKGGLTYTRGNGLGFDVNVTSAKKSGYQPWGAAFAFNNANELPMPLDNVTNDVTAALEYASQKGMARVAWTGSFFNNEIQQLVWDNPLRATDFNSGNPAVPYDPSGYSNGNGAAFGRQALFPSNSMNAISASAMYKLPKRTVVNTNFAFTSFNQNEELIPWTTNSVVQPFIGDLPRATADAKVHGYNFVVNMSSNPTRLVGFNARFRYNDRKNLTEHFESEWGTVRFDAVPEFTEDIGHYEAHYADITQNQFEAGATFNLVKYTALRVGYVRDAFERTHRVYTNIADNIVKMSVDTVGNQYFMVRGMYEYTQRRGDAPDLEILNDSGHQPATRWYDEADRDRNRATLLFVLTPVSMFDVTVSAAVGNDDYVDPRQEFGLLDNDNHSYNVGFTLTPVQTVTAGVNFGYDEFKGYQVSRTANPAPDAQFADPLRNWDLTNEEIVKNVDLFLNVSAIKNVEIRTGYNLSDSDNGFLFGGPRVQAVAAAGTFLPLPNVTNQWQRASVDLQYFFSKQVGLALGYWYEKFDVNDFATVDLPGQPGVPRIDYLGEIYTGYGNRGYEGNTAFVRMLYRF